MKYMEFFLLEQQLNNMYNLVVFSMVFNYFSDKKD